MFSLELVEVAVKAPLCAHKTKAKNQHFYDSQKLDGCSKPSVHWQFTYLLVEEEFDNC